MKRFQSNGLYSTILPLFLLLALSSCNKEGFYEKQYLAGPDASTEVDPGADNGAQDGGVDSGDAGGTQGGVDSGATGGTVGGATTGSTSGGSTDGSATGGTTNGSSTGGSSSGGTDGSVTTGGSSTGSTVGGTDGSSTTTGGSSTGSTTTTGSSTGGSTTGGDTTTTGSSTGGSTTTTGSSTGGMTTGGSSTGGSSTGSSTGGTTGASYTAVEEKFKQNAEQTKKLDVLWIIDDSGSMADEQDSLGRNFDAFITDFIDKNVDFKMAITTTDVSSSTRRGRMVTGSDTKLTSAKAQENEVQFMSDFKNLVKVGISGSGNEKGLEASEWFMSKHAASWMRSDAYLAVVILSDEEDQSPKSVDYYWNKLISYKVNPGLVKVYSIVDATNSNPLANITLGHERYEAMATASAGITADISKDFAPILSDMGQAIINLLDSFALASDPVAGSMKVYVNDVETTEYTYDGASRSIKFNQGHIPQVNATIRVTYMK